MINRDLKPIKVRTYTGKDSYGQMRKGIYVERDSQMAIYLKVITDENTPQFVDATHIGITKDQEITTDNSVIFNNDEYNVLYVIPSKRYYQVLLKKV